MGNCPPNCCAIETLTNMENRLEPNISHIPKAINFSNIAKGNDKCRAVPNVLRCRTWRPQGWAAGAYNAEINYPDIYAIEQEAAANPEQSPLCGGLGKSCDIENMWPEGVIISPYTGRLLYGEKAKITQHYMNDETGEPYKRSYQRCSGQRLRGVGSLLPKN
tara:strand:- start:740 stop:1225 length:486 start_codon:yes stop_codon:yes gene_type:complete